MEYVWKILDMTRDLQDGFVLSVKWQLVATNGSQATELTGHCGFDRQAGEVKLKPFEALTEAEALKWIWANGFDRQAQEDFAALKMDEDAAAEQAPRASGLPWGAAPDDAA